MLVKMFDMIVWMVGWDVQPKKPKEIVTSPSAGIHGATSLLRSLDLDCAFWTQDTMTNEVLAHDQRALTANVVGRLNR